MTRGRARSNAPRTIAPRCLFGWREVPVSPEVCGPSARETLPAIRQIFVGPGTLPAEHARWAGPRAGLREETFEQAAHSAAGRRARGGGPGARGAPLGAPRSSSRCRRQLPRVGCGPARPRSARGRGGTARRAAPCAPRGSCARARLDASRARRPLHASRDGAAHGGLPPRSARGPGRPRCRGHRRCPAERRRRPRGCDRAPCDPERRGRAAGGGARAEASRLELLPRVELLGAIWARGSGLPYPGQTPLADATGLLPDRPGWALGLLVTWRVLDLPAVEVRMRAAEARARADRARSEALRGRLDAQVREARAQHREAVAVEAPARAALEAAQRALAIVEAAQEVAPASDRLAALRLLASAAIEHAVADVAREQAALLLARARGDLEPFVARYRRRSRHRVRRRPQQHRHPVQLRRAVRERADGSGQHRPEDGAGDRAHRMAGREGCFHRDRSRSPR